MTLGTIIAIVLGIAVLVFLIFGFSTGWSNMWDKVTAGTSGSNVQVKIADCDNDCSSGEKTSWCSEKKTLKYIGDDGKTVKVSETCADLSLGIVDGKTDEKVKKLDFKDCKAFRPCVA